MSDCIDPGPGWRLLNPEEIVEDGDEFLLDGAWRISGNAGTTQCLICRYRRRTREPHTTKAIATRATVRISSKDGRTTEWSIDRKSGLTKADSDVIKVHYAIAEGVIRRSEAKYIMLEIQREGEP